MDDNGWKDLSQSTGAGHWEGGRLNIGKDIKILKTQAPVKFIP